MGSRAQVEGMALSRHRNASLIVTVIKAESVCIKVGKKINFLVGRCGNSYLIASTFSVQCYKLRIR